MSETQSEPHRWRFSLRTFIELFLLIVFFTGWAADRWRLQQQVEQQRIESLADSQTARQLLMWFDANWDKYRFDDDRSLNNLKKALEQREQSEP